MNSNVPVDKLTGEVMRMKTFAGDFLYFQTCYIYRPQHPENPSDTVRPSMALNASHSVMAEQQFGSSQVSPTELSLFASVSVPV